MTRVCLLAVIVAAVGFGSTSAHAGGGYLGLGIGTAPSLSDDRFAPDGRSAKVLIGQRWGQFAVEGAVGGVDLLNSHSIVQASAAGQMRPPPGDRFPMVRS